MCGPGGYTSQSIREAWRRRVQQNLPWGRTGGHADTTEAIERTLAIAILYALKPEQLASCVAGNTILTQTDDTVVSMTVAYCAVLGLLVQGHPFDSMVSARLMKLVSTCNLSFHAETREDFKPPLPGDPDPPRAGRFASPDALLTPACIAAEAAEPEIRIEPAWKVSMVYGMPCAIYHQLPAAYYLAARFSDDFESAILHAINGGGQNQARYPYGRPGRGTDRAVRHPPTVPRRPAKFGCSDKLVMRACRRDVGLSCRCSRESIAFPAECSLQLFWSAILEIEFQYQIWYAFIMAEVLEE